MEVLKINFSHNHPIVSAHSLSFRPIRSETKEIFFKLFDDGHSASSARHNYEQHLLLDAATDEQKQYSLADRAINPSVQDVCRLFQQWRKKCYGDEDGKPLFERVQLEVDNYNAKYSEQGGRAVLQWYEKHIPIGDGIEETVLPRRSTKGIIVTNHLFLLFVHHLCQELMSMFVKQENCYSVTLLHPWIDLIPQYLFYQLTLYLLVFRWVLF